MSANNVIYVQRQGSNFFVWHTDIDEGRGPHMGDVVDAATLEDAIDIAHKLADEYMVVEYGVQVLPTNGVEQ